MPTCKPFLPKTRKVFVRHEEGRTLLRARRSLSLPQ